MKKCIKVVLCISLLFVLASTLSWATSENQEYYDAMEILKDNDILEEKLITRQECLVSIMKILGVTQEISLKTNPRYVPVFDDSYNSPYYGYFVYAFDNDIAYGTVRDNKRLFEPTRYATYTEALTFIVRCLTKETVDVEEYALENGILKKSDTFYDILDDYITKDEFCVLLGRMLKCKCCVYVGKEIDNPQSKTYEEIIEERKALGISVKGYSLVEMVRGCGGRKRLGDLYGD